MNSLAERFWGAWGDAQETLDADLLPSALARITARLLPFDAAGLSLHGEPDTRVPLGASDDAAATAERLQFTHGDGPCFLAMRDGRPVVATEDRWRELWPVLAVDHFARTSFHGGLSVPLRVGSSRFGVLDLYTRSSRTLDGSTVIDAQVVAALVTSVLLQHLRGVDPTGFEPEAAGVHADWSDSPEAIRRRQVWVATGMVGLSLAVTSEQALSILRAHAFATSTTLDDLADDIVQRRFDVEELGSGTAS
ncbi:GAF domain-containing protein [Kineococcus sp. GCM10028916]|uniref:GAF domain-containing protein n=1 Tax=Kineococcus sp. GCM10028916 TaxID=3273394 RepID=UPI00362F153E